MFKFQKTLFKVVYIYVYEQGEWDLKYARLLNVLSEICKIIRRYFHVLLAKTFSNTFFVHIYDSTLTYNLNQKTTFDILCRTSRHTHAHIHVSKLRGTNKKIFFESTFNSTKVYKTLPLRTLPFLSLSLYLFLSLNFFLKDNVFGLTVSQQIKRHTIIGKQIE